MILKRITSYVVSLLVIVSMLLGTSTAFALGTATQRLEDIQQITGFVPGENSIIQNNCYGFASEVCQKLYGVAYKEGLYNNFRVKQSSGNYQTVGVFTSPNTSADSKFAQQVKDFFVSRAVAGDVVHYGSLNTNSHKTHTFIIQYIDDEKMQIYHSNYSVPEFSSKTCHIDTIYWQSMINNPTRSIYDDDDSLYSLNAIFHSTMKVSGSGGIGISISHFKNYGNMYCASAVDSEQDDAEPEICADELEVTGLTVTKQECNRILFEWDEVENATRYYVLVNNNTKGTTFNKTVEDSFTSIAGLDPGNVYTIRVCAYAGNSKGEYSTPVVTASRPKKEAIKSFYSSGKGKVYVKWKKLAGSCTGYQIQYCKDKSFKSNVITKTIKDKSKLSYTRKGLAGGKTYYIRVRGITSYSGGTAYGTWSSVKSVKCK